MVALGAGLASEDCFRRPVPATTSLEFLRERNSSGRSIESPNCGESIPENCYDLGLLEQTENLVREVTVQLHLISQIPYNNGNN